MARINAIHFSQAQYRPGEDVLVEVCLRAEGACQAAALGAAVTDVLTVVYEDSKEIEPATRNVKLRIPGHVLHERLVVTGRLDRAIGFGLRIELTDCDSTARASASFDVAPHWRCAPRYGFVCEFASNTASDPSKWQRMADMHMNVVQFYDWMYRHHQLIPESNVFRDPLGRLLDLSQVCRQAELARRFGIAPIAYGAMYGAEQEFADAHPEMGAYKLDGTQHSLANFIWIMDIERGSAWRDHVIDQYADAIDKIGFEGIHLDQYGFPRVYYTRDGRHVQTEREFAPFVQACRDRLGYETGLIFNAVNGWPVQEVAAAPQDAVYIEVWPPHDTYRDLRELVLRGHREAEFGKQVILAAYMKPFATNTLAAIPNEPAEIALRLTSAAIMSSGGFHLVLGEGDAVLTEGYYPHYARLSDEFMTIMEHYWDFAVRHEEFLFDLGARDTYGVEVGGTDQGLEVVGYPYSPWGEAGKVWATVRHGRGYKLLQLVNLVGVDDPRWNEPKKSPPTVLHDVTIRWLLDDEIRDLLLASPDLGDASWRPVPYRESPGDHGRVIEFTLERLDYWSIIVVRSASAPSHFSSRLI